MLTICLTLLSLAVSHAKGNIFDSIPEKKDTSITEKFAIYYRFDKSEFDQTYLTNSETAAHIKNYLINSPRIDSITIYAWASPEGAYLHNVKLSQRRARTAKRFLLSHAPDSTKLNADKIKISPLAENWQGLEAMVVEKYRRHDREKVLTILRDRTIGDETRKWRLQQLDGGYTWKYMLRHYMPLLRAATWICVWAEVIDPLPAVEQKAIESVPVGDNGIIPVPQIHTTKGNAPLYAIRSNLLVPALNIGAEVPLGNRWSVSADYYFPWIWPSKTNRNCFELLGWSLEGSYWFGRNRTAADRLKGHSIGLYGAGGYYDFERDYKGQQGEFASIGLDYTWSMPIGKRKRVNLEFTLAVGYIHAWARNYTVHGEYGPLFKEEGDVIFDYFGPTKAAVNLVIPFYGKEGRK